MPTTEGGSPLVKTFLADADAATILQTKDIIVCEAPFDGVVSSCTYAAIAAVTGGADPTSRTLSLINKGQTGVGTTAVATLALLSGVNLVAYDEKAITLSSTPADLVVASGDVLEWHSVAVGGTGLVDPGGTVTVQISRT